MLCLLEVYLRDNEGGCSLTIVLDYTDMTAEKSIFKRQTADCGRFMNSPKRFNMAN